MVLQGHFEGHLYGPPGMLLGPSLQSSRDPFESISMVFGAPPLWSSRDTLGSISMVFGAISMVFWGPLWGHLYDLRGHLYGL